jgi:hypothetical protein
MLLTYGSAKTHAHSTFGHRQSQTLKHGCRNSGRSQAFESYVPSSCGKADPPRRYKSELLRSSGGGSETGCDRMAILSGRPSPVGWSEVQHRYYEFLDSRRTGLRWLTALIQKLWDVAWDMWDHRNRALRPGTFGRTRPTDSDYR